MKIGEATEHALGAWSLSLSASLLLCLIKTGSQLPWRFGTSQPSPSWSLSTYCYSPSAPAEVWALMEGLLLFIRHLRARRGSKHPRSGQGTPWSAYKWLGGGREPLTYFQSKNLAHSGMEVSLPSEGPHLLWVPMISGPGKGKVPGNDFLPPTRT